MVQIVHAQCEGLCCFVVIFFRVSFVVSTAADIRTNRSLQIPSSTLQQGRKLLNIQSWMRSDESNVVLAYRPFEYRHCADGQSGVHARAYILLTSGKHDGRTKDEATRLRIAQDDRYALRQGKTRGTAESIRSRRSIQRKAQPLIMTTQNVEAESLMISKRLVVLSGESIKLGI